MIKTGKKGFIGAIGDDFPSLIPLFFAILIFFAALGYAFTTINDRNLYINTYVDSLKIAKTALGKGVFSGYGDFLSSAEGLLTTSNYVFGLVYIDYGDDFQEFTINEIKKELFVRIEAGELVLSDECSDRCRMQYSGEDLSSFQTVYGGAYYFLKGSPASEKILDSGDTISIDNLSRTGRVFTYVYPVALKTPKGVIPVYLVVIVW